MLERTAGCLESGSLRRLLPASKKALKSRRSLHSTFWTHGASDLELSPLWTALVAMAEPVQKSEEQLQARSPAGQSTALLDFLYPAGTLNFLRNYSGWGVDRLDGRWTRNVFGKVGHRTYTSFAKDLDLNEDPLANSEGTANDQVDRDAAKMAALYKTLGLKKSSDYEEAWRHYRYLDDEKQKPFRQQLIQYLSPSDRVVDAERITELFEMIGTEERTPNTYRCAIRSFLKLRNLTDAMTLQQVALEKLDTPAGSEELLAYLVKNASWSRAFSLYKQVADFRLQHSSESRSQAMSFNIFEVLDTDPTLGSQAIELAQYVNRKIETSSSGNPADNDELTRFASRVVRRALLSSRSFSPSRFLPLLMTLQKWGFTTPQLYENAVQMLVQQNEHKLAVKCYRHARQGEDVKFTRPTLHTVLKICCDNHSVIGMRQILDDFFRIYRRPTPVAYKLCMAEFAAQGDAQTVHALFDQYTGSMRSRGLRPVLKADELAPILHVHAKRGEIQEVVTFFDQMHETYGVKPNLLCWNILLDAYGKVQDVDHAIETFETLLYDENFQPDDYTFGTMMGICAGRGDLDRVIELYRLAKKLEIKINTPMVDCLIQAHIKEGDLERAEELCEDALRTEFKGSRTRMWNQLITAYAMARDLVTVNRILQRMSEAGVDYDQYTYSALMQVLSIIGQPDRADAILQEVMPQAGIKATSFHYAVVLGGYLANGELHKAIKVQQRMQRRNIRRDASIQLLSLKIMVEQDEKLLAEGSAEELLQRAMAMFQEIIAAMDPQDISSTARKGAGHVPLDVAYSSMFYNYMIYVFGQKRQFGTVQDLYNEFTRTLPQYRQGYVPLEMLSALMTAKLEEGNYPAVQECWDIALAHAKEKSAPLSIAKGTAEDEVPSDNPQGVLPARQIDLRRHLEIYLRSLFLLGRDDRMITTVEGLLKDGFKLDNKNWNLYIMNLSRCLRYKLAFELCETHLMPGWTGWARVRWQLPERNRLPIEVRNSRKEPRHLRPLYITLLTLAKGFLELQAMAAESRGGQILMSDLERDCPKTLRAIQEMQRVDDDLERSVLKGF